MLFTNTDVILQPSSRRSLTPQGFLKIEDCRLARSGILEYLAANFQPRMFNDRAPDSIIRVYRPPAEVDAAAAAFSGAPATNDHPRDMLDATNTRQFQVGHINGDVRIEDTTEGRMMIADIIITDQKTIRDIEAGKTELSNGYYSRYDFTPGVAPDGQQYDCIQVGIRANHVALVDQGRCGTECRVSDSQDDIPPANTGDKPMAMATINGVSYEASDQLAQAVGVLHASLDTANEQLAKAGNVEDKVKAAVDAANATSQTKIDTLQGEVDGLKGNQPTADSINALVLAQTDTVAAAKRIDPKYDPGTKDAAAIKKDIVMTQCKDLKDAGDLSADYIAARFDSLKLAVPGQMKKGLGEHINNDGAADGENIVNDAKAARSKRIADQFKR